MRRIQLFCENIVTTELPWVSTLRSTWFLDEVALHGDEQGLTQKEIFPRISGQQSQSATVPQRGPPSNTTPVSWAVGYG